MESYINITLDLSLLARESLDLRIPSTMILKEMLQTVLDSYKIDASIINPTARILQTGELLASTTALENLKNGMLIKLETV